MTISRAPSGRRQGRGGDHRGGGGGGARESIKHVFLVVVLDGTFTISLVST